MTAEWFEILQFQAICCDGVVAHLWMPIERQVIGDQIEFAFDESCDASSLKASEGSGSSFPEDAVMYEDRVRLPSAGPLEELQAGGNPGDDPANCGLAFDLETVRTEVGNLVRCQVSVQVGE